LDELFLYTVPELLDLELFSSSFAAARSSVICKAIFVLESFLPWCPVLSRRSVLIFPAQSIATGLGSAVVFNFYRSHLFFLLQCSSGPLPVLLAPGIFMFPAGAVQRKLLRSSSKCALGFSWLDLVSSIDRHISSFS
jgi:hypothetical protein